MIPGTTLYLFYVCQTRILLCLPGLPELSSLLPLCPSGQTRAVASQCHGWSKEDHRSEGRLARERPGEAQVVSLHMLLGHRAGGCGKSGRCAAWRYWALSPLLGPEPHPGVCGTALLELTL